jgi:CubicO group peptidase (beta-lactamase class C family)
VNAEIAETLDGVVEATAFSGVVRVSRRGDVVYERAAGFADRAHRIANSVGTQFGMASGSKGFTALAIFSLVLAGKLSLDTRVRDVLGDDLPLIDDGVTVAHLLEHTSGIGDYMDESAGGDINDYVLPISVHRLLTAEDFVPVLDGFPQSFPPGERFAYCNGGFAVLSVVVERVSGRPFTDVVDDVLRPAGMTSTAYLRSDALPGSAAIGYLADGVRTNIFHLPVRGAGDGGAYTTLDDIERFWAALFDGRIIPRDVVADMVVPRHDVPEDQARYGRGFWLDPEADPVRLVGYDAGVSFRTTYDPASGWLFTVIANTSEGAWPLVRQLDEALPGLVATA